MTKDTGFVFPEDEHINTSPVPQVIIDTIS